MKDTQDLLDVDEEAARYVLFTTLQCALNTYYRGVSPRPGKEKPAIRLIATCPVFWELFQKFDTAGEP